MHAAVPLLKLIGRGRALAMGSCSLCARRRHSDVELVTGDSAAACPPAPGFPHSVPVDLPGGGFLRPVTSPSSTRLVWRQSFRTPEEFLNPLSAAAERAD